MSEWDNANLAAMQQAQYASAVPVLGNLSIAKRIDLAITQAEEKLAAVRRAKELFEKNPDLEELLNIMQRSHF
jgi:hypothetical protein